MFPIGDLLSGGLFTETFLTSRVLLELHLMNTRSPSLQRFHCAAATW